MKTLPFYILLLLLIISCQKDSPLPDPQSPTDPKTEEVPGSDVSSYDPTQLPPTVTPQENLLTNGSFEEDDGLWTLCGASSIISSSDARDGNNYLEIIGQGTCDQYTDSFGELYGNAYYPLNISSIPELIHISFYVRASKQLDINSDPLIIQLLGNLNYDIINSRAVSFLNIHSDVIGTEWTLIKLSLKKQEIQDYLGDLVPKWLNFSMFSAYGIAEDITISIDNVRVTYEKEVTQPEPMPESLLNYAGNDRILFVNSDKQVAATMKPNGSDLINYENILTENLTSIPYWYNSNEITLGEIEFNPPNVSGTTISASQTDLYRYDLNSINKELMFETLGNPGRYEFDGSANNLDALDVEIRRVAWDAPRNRGALSVCARNRSFGFVSDDYCLIYIIDEEGNTVSSDTEGFNAAWSHSGKLAYVLNGSIYVADVSGGAVNSSVVYERTGINDVVDWSPDGTSLVFMQRAGDVLEFGESSEWAYAIKTLNLTTGKVTDHVLIDHGKAYPNVSWSNDGKFIIYSLFLPSSSDPNLGNSQIWWAEIATGKTGPITNTINAFGGTFRK